MKIKELENIAYEIATGCITIKTLNLKKWNKCSIENILWEPIEDLGTDFTKDLVSCISTNIVIKFKHLCSDYDE